MQRQQAHSLNCRGKPGQHAQQLAPPFHMWTDFGVEWRPRRPKLNHGAVALDIQFAESGRKNLRSGARS